MGARTGRRYAQAVFNILDRPEAIEQVEKDLTAFHKLVAGIPALGRVIVHPGVSAERRRGILDQALDTLGCHPASRGLISLLAAERDLRQLPAVIEAVGRLREEKLNVATALVTTAMPLAIGDRPAWESALGRAAGKPVRIEFKTDPSLIGGAVARIGSVLYDGSVRGSLQRIRQSLIGD